MTTSTTHTGEQRPMRADAVRNRARIIEAAKAAFAASGLETQMEDVARRAEVGVGTVYRHFPTKDALVRALIVDKFERIAEVARVALEEPDPWKAFSGVLRAGAEQQRRDRSLMQIFAAQPQEAFRIAIERDTKLGERMEELLARAQRAGAVRPDLRPDDIPLVMCGLGAVMQSDRNGERYLALMLDGFRARGAEPLPD